VSGEHQSPTDANLDQWELGCNLIIKGNPTEKYTEVGKMLRVITELRRMKKYQTWELETRKKVLAPIVVKITKQKEIIAELTVLLNRALDDLISAEGLLRNDELVNDIRTALKGGEEE